MRISLLTALLAVLAWPAAAQTDPRVTDPAVLDAAVAKAAVESAQAGPPVTLTFANRPILQLRASLLGRAADERVAGGLASLERMAEEGVTGPVEARQIGEAISLEVAGRRIVAIVPADVDTLAGETPAGVAAAAVGRIETVLDEVAELRRPRQLLVAVLLVVLVTALFVALTWGLMKARRAASQRIREATERKLQATKVGDAELIRSSRVFEFIDRSIGVLAIALFLFFAYSWVTFSLRRFPYTRPWGESLRAFLLGQLASVGVAIVESLPGLFTVALIFLLTRFVVRVVNVLFLAIEQGRLELPWVYPETAEPTRKLLTVGLWLFGVAIAYPYLPGSGSDAFKGMSVFVGLVLSLGSSGIVNQMMSGFTLTYSRALRVGDFVTVGDVEGVVTQVGTLSTKIKTLKAEDVTIPNTVMVSNVVTNYSRFADAEGVYVPTEVTIGYDVPWRQVEALLLLAAARTPGIRRQPPPMVRQAALDQAYVRYTLLFCLENPTQRRMILAAVHQNILDAFNEYGVQITSPSYEADPEVRKVVPKDRWFAAPAVPAEEKEEKPAP